METAAGIGALPYKFSVETVELHEMAFSRFALLVHLACAIEIRCVVLYAADDGAVAVVEVLHMPHGAHRVQVYADDVAVVVAEITIVAIHAEACFNTR